jgi:hypothetical protein
VERLTIEVVHQNGITIAEINDFPTDVLKTLLIVGKLECRGLKWEIRDSFVYLDETNHSLEHAWVVLEVS